MQSHDEYPFFLRVGKKSVIQGSIHYTIYNPGGGIAPKSFCQPPLNNKKKKKKTQQNEQNTRRRKHTGARRPDPPASFKSAVWEHFGWWIGRGRCTGVVRQRCGVLMVTQAKHAKSYQKASPRFGNHRSPAKDNSSSTAYPRCF